MSASIHLRDFDLMARRAQKYRNQIAPDDVRHLRRIVERVAETLEKFRRSKIAIPIYAIENLKGAIQAMEPPYTLQEPPLADEHQPRETVGKSAQPRETATLKPNESRGGFHESFNALQKK